MNPLSPRRPIAILLLLLFAAAVNVRADAPKGPAPDVRPVPPPGNELAPAERAELQVGLGALGKEIDALRDGLRDKPQLLAYLPDVQIYYNAVRYPLAYRELIDVKAAHKALDDGMARAKALSAGQAPPPWAAATGPRGYVSRIDGSVQPYVLVVPSSYKAGEPGGAAGASGENKRFRLDLNCHGRDEKLTELKFISANSAAAADKFVVHLYGRYCNANKFAGEIDCLEVKDAVSGLYPIDDNRVLMIGFSMGGAACWQFATHYADLWAAASPGAGFAESRLFLHLKDDEMPPWYEQSLWHLYDCTDYAVNLYNVPTVAYAGEIDPQKQSSDVMAKAMEAEGLTLERIIGPKTLHMYEKNAKIELDKRLDVLLAKGRDPAPKKIRFTTWTLRYNRMFWVRVDGLDRHWERARVEAEFQDDGGPTFRVKTQNVSELTLSHPHPPVAPPGAHFDMALSAEIDGTKVELPGGRHNATSLSLAKADGKWMLAETVLRPPLRKVHGLQGPIDDAFMERFLIVRPTGKPLHPKVSEWAAAECEHAIDHWRKQFRGEARVKKDTEVTEADWADSNLVLFGDLGSNKLLARMAGQLPVAWTPDNITLNGRTFSSDHHVPVLIYPNPLNPKRYVVLNSGFTFRELDYLNNARQTPKLPDYAVIDVDVPPSSRGPGEVVTAGFFGENWELLKDDGHPKGKTRTDE